MSIKNINQTILTLPLLLGINNIFAGGFQMHEQNAQLGDVHAGYSVNTDDASINFYNPAGLIDITEALTTTSAVTVANNISFTGNTRVNTYPEPSSPGHLPFTANGSASTNGLHVIPGAHFAKPLSENLAFGFSIASPYAAELQWSDNSFTRYNTTLNGIKTINFSPSLAYKVNNQFYIGFGPEVQYIEMNINKMVGSALHERLFNQSFDSVVTNKLSNVALSWHAGVMFKPTNNIKFGASFRPGINHNAKGQGKLKGKLAGSFESLSPEKENISKNLKATIKIPSSLAISTQISPSADYNFVASLIYTKWSVVKDFALKNVTTAFVHPDTNELLFLKEVSNTMNFKDTLTLLTGTHWHYNNNLKLKAGLGYDQTPTSDKERDLRMPDGNRFLFGLGANYKYSQDLNIELGYMFVKINPTKISKKSIIQPPISGEIAITNPGEISEIHGKASGYANLLGIQTTFNTDKIIRRFV